MMIDGQWEAVEDHTHITHTTNPTKGIVSYHMGKTLSFSSPVISSTN
jgi:hypothetical protein